MFLYEYLFEPWLLENLIDSDVNFKDIHTLHKWAVPPALSKTVSGHDLLLFFLSSPFQNDNRSWTDTVLDKAGGTAHLCTVCMPENMKWHFWTKWELAWVCCGSFLGIKNRKRAILPLKKGHCFIYKTTLWRAKLMALAKGPIRLLFS